MAWARWHSESQAIKVLGQWPGLSAVRWGLEEGGAGTMSVFEFDVWKILHVLMFDIEDDIIAYFLITHNTKCAKENKERNWLFDTGNLNIHGMPKPIISCRNGHIDLFGRNTFEIGDRFNFS